MFVFVHFKASVKKKKMWNVPTGCSFVLSFSLSISLSLTFPSFYKHYIPAAVPYDILGSRSNRHTKSAIRGQKRRKQIE